MANITVLEALQLSLNATKKYVDDNKFSKNYEDLNNEPFTFVPIKLTETNESNGAITAYCDVFDLEQGHRYVADFTKYDYVCLYTFNSDNTKNTLVATTAYLSTGRNGMITVLISSATKRDILWMSAYGSEQFRITKNSDETFTITNSLIVPRVANTKEFTPTSDYHLVHKKYVDENNQLYWMEPYEITGTKTKLANVDISTLTKNRLYTFNYKKYSEIDKVGIKKIYDDGTKKSITTLSQGLEYIYFSDLSSIGFTMYIKYSHGTSSKITGTFGSTASEYTSTLTPMVLDTQSNKEFIPTKEYDPTTKKYVDDKVAGVNASMITGLATVATSGDYNDLNNKPTISTVTNDLTNELKANYDAAYTHSTSAHAPSNAQANADITKAEIEAKLTGDITSHTHNQYLTEHQDISGLAPKANPSFTGNATVAGKVTVGTAPTEDMDVATKQYVDNAVAAADYGPYSIRYNSENNRLEFIYTPTN